MMTICMIHIPYCPVARYVNTQANMGLPKENRKISIVMQRGSGLIGLNNGEFRARHDGKDNPNINWSISFIKPLLLFTCANRA